MKASIIVNLNVIKEWPDAPEPWLSAQAPQRESAVKIWLLSVNKWLMVLSWAIWGWMHQRLHCISVTDEAFLKVEVKVVYYSSHSLIGNNLALVRSGPIVLGRVLHAGRVENDASETDTFLRWESAIDWTIPHYQRSIDGLAGCKLSSTVTVTVTANDLGEILIAAFQLYFSVSCPMSVRQAVVWLGWGSLEVVGGVTFVYKFTLNDNKIIWELGLIFILGTENVKRMHLFLDRFEYKC